MNDSRFKLPDEAVQLPSGKLLVAGGSKEVEVFDPASGKFVVVAGQMNEQVALHVRNQAERRQRAARGRISERSEATAQAWIYRP